MSNPAQYPLDHAVKEVSTRSRRRFTASEKAQILNTFEGARTPFERSSVLRAHGVSRSQVRAWQRAFASAGPKGLEARKPGPIPRYDDKDQLIVQLQHRIEQLTREVATATALVELQKKAISIFDAAQSKIDRSCATGSPIWPSPMSPPYPYDASATL
jgi:transposase-like protein